MTIQCRWLEKLIVNLITLLGGGVWLHRRGELGRDHCRWHRAPFHAAGCRFHLAWRWMANRTDLLREQRVPSRPQDSTLAALDISEPHELRRALEQA